MFFFSRFQKFSVLLLCCPSAGMFFTKIPLKGQDLAIWEPDVLENALPRTVS
jgi:hypothetical protein